MQIWILGNFNDLRQPFISTCTWVYMSVCECPGGPKMAEDLLQLDVQIYVSYLILGQGTELLSSSLSKKCS